jgi:signal transduction histidine kinase
VIARGRQLAFDLVVAAVAAVAEVSLMVDDGHAVSVAAIVVAVLSAGALLARRRAPLLVLAVTLAAAAALAALEQFPGGIPALVALFSVAERRDWRVSIAALAVTAPVLALGSIVSVPPTIVVWGLGLFAHTRRQYTQALEERTVQLEREREQLARLAVHEERASIARELHDIVAHSVSVMLHGVRGARDVLDTDPREANATLARVETSGEQSMAELRRILALLRDSEQSAESRPQPSLADLDELVAGYRDAGLAVSLEVIGQPRALPGGVELSVYRIVQEALTNVLKHAGARSAAVTLTFDERGLAVEIVDDAEPTHEATAEPLAGHGMVGMRERVALLGGELHAGQRAGGGFRVAARLPVRERA